MPYPQRPPNGHAVPSCSPELLGASSGTTLQNAAWRPRVAQGIPAILDHGFVVAWGDAEYGGDGSAKQHLLKDVRHIETTFGSAFAAILGVGSVVTWGASCGDCSAVQDRLKQVEHIQCNQASFAAILADGSVVTWGADTDGVQAVQGQLKNVQHIQSTQKAFAAILDDGSVVTWGKAGHGGDSRFRSGSAETCQTHPSH